MLDIQFWFHSAEYDGMCVWLDLLEGLARIALEVLSTLEFVKFAIRFPKETLQACWRVLRVDGRPVLELVSQDDCDAIRSIDRMFIPPSAWKSEASSLHFASLHQPLTCSSLSIYVQARDHPFSNIGEDRMS